MSVLNESSSLSQVSEDRPVFAEAMDDRPVVLALSASALVFGAAVAGCLIVTEGVMPVGHVLYVSLLIALTAGALGLLVAGLTATGMTAARSVKQGLASRPARHTTPAAGSLAME